MKKVLTSLVGVMSVIAVANAEPYVGLNLTYDNMKFTNSEFNEVFNRNQLGAAIDLGYQFSDYLGVEAYYQYAMPMKKDLKDESGAKEAETKLSFMSGGLDIMGYLPLNSCHSLNLIGTIGGGYYRFELKYKEPNDPEEKMHENHLAARMGAGVQYNIDESMSVRALGRFITWKADSNDKATDEHDMMKNMFEASLGFQYKF